MSTQPSVRPGAGTSGAAGSRNQKLLLWTAAAVIPFILLSVGTALTKRPWCDEAWFASPALDLVVNGRMGTQVLEPTGSFMSVQTPGVRLDRIDQRTYWVMPLHFLVLALWFKLFGFSLTVLRLAAIAWGLTALAACYAIVGQLGGSRELAILAIFFIGIDSAFIDSASDGRMDMMCAALGFVALAAYLSLRETNFRCAVVAGHTAAALSVFTHPNGVMASAALLLSMLYLDRERFSWLTLPLAAIPYVAAALGWGLYILQDPTAFRAQFGANSLGRSVGLTAPFEALWLEIRVRYLESHFLPADAGSFSYLKVLVLAAYFGAVIAMIAVPELRRHRACRLLLYLTGLRFLMMAVLISFKYESYLVNILPLYAVILACAISWLWQRPSRIRWAAAVVLCAVLAVQSIWSLNRILRYRPYQTKYQPAVSFLKAHMTSQDLVFGSAELGFSFGFYNRRIVDDLWLGRWSGKQPTIIVMDKWRYYKTINDKPSEFTQYATQLLQRDFHQVYSQDEGYQIYARNQVKQ
jgi:4-amino-4-deoxy-L-arabinose transferase-like glycosyltransferase